MANLRDTIADIRKMLGSDPRLPELEEEFERHPKVRAEMERIRQQQEQRYALQMQDEMDRLRLIMTAVSPPPAIFQVPSSFPTKANPFGNALGFGPIFPDEQPRTPPLDRGKLATLKLATPHRVYQKAPDRIEVITAWRAWGVDGLRLKALGQHTVWEPRKQVDAACVPDFKKSDHPAPNRDCQCGVWAFKSLDLLVPALDPYTGVRVLGQVSLWGRVIETENGYRSQHAYPSELWLLDDSLEELGYIYDVPVRTC